TNDAELCGLSHRRGIGMVCDPGRPRLPCAVAADRAAVARFVAHAVFLLRSILWRRPAALQPCGSRAFTPHPDRFPGSRFAHRRPRLADRELWAREGSCLDVPQEGRRHARNEPRRAQSGYDRVDVERRARRRCALRGSPVPAPGAGIVMLTPVLPTLALVVLWVVVFVGMHLLGLRSGRGNAHLIVGRYSSSSLA